jgi:hypothetical protein
MSTNQNSTKFLPTGQWVKIHGPWGLQQVSVTDASSFRLVTLWNINGHVKYRFRVPSTIITHIHDRAYCLFHIVSMRDRQDS